MTKWLRLFCSRFGGLPKPQSDMRIMWTYINMTHTCNDQVVPAWSVRSRSPWTCRLVWRLFPVFERTGGVIQIDPYLSGDMTKPTKWVCAKQRLKISLGIRPVWSESSLSAWRKFGSLATHWAHSEDSDQTGRMPRLIWVFARCTLTLLVLSCPL